MVKVFIIFSKAALLIVYLVCFGYYFIQPAVNRYLKKNTMILTSEENHPEGLTPPAVTLCVSNPQGGGWKVKPIGKPFVLTNYCPDSGSIEEMYKCIDEGTFDLEEAASFETSAVPTSQNTSKFWAQKFSFFPNGMCYTLNYTGLLGTNKYADVLKIVLPLLDEKTEQSFVYNFWIHDPDFFVFSLNSLAIPHHAWKQVDAGFQVQVAVTEHKKMNQPLKDNPCNEDPGYSFNRCVETSLSKMVGCRTKYEDCGQEDIALCTTTQQVLHMSKLWTNLSISERREIEAMTECFGPCKFRTFEVISEDRYRTFGVSMATKVLTVEEEVLDYPFLSFFAEVAGAEGVFFGFSLFSLLFIVDIIFMKIKQL